jgi:hypothetical protein
MGTPAVITFKGRDNYGSPQEIAFYRHCDGDPLTALTDFIAILVHANVKLGEAREESPHIAEHFKLNPSLLAGLYIAENTTASGMAVQFNPNPGDSYGEWRYEVNTDGGTIRVAGDDKTTIDPQVYVSCLHTEYQGACRARIAGAVEALSILGFDVNP